MHNGFLILFFRTLVYLLPCGMKVVAHRITFGLLAMFLALLATDTRADESARRTPMRKRVQLPGLVIDIQDRCVDLKARVCLREGFLELVACTKGSKEHESIFAVAARPMHIHTALLLLGANNGNPAMRKQVGESEKRWVDIPPQGDPIEVFLVLKNAEGQLIERPVRDFIKRANDRTDEIGKDRVVREESNVDKDGQADNGAMFPKVFLFAGSHLRDKGTGPREYLADRSGHVISIATFGDEILCLPSIQTHENGALAWKVHSQGLPDVGTEVTLRLRPKGAKSPQSKSSPPDSAVSGDPDTKRMK